MIAPPFLKKGDTIGIVACAGKISEAQIRFAIQELEQWGLRVIVGSTVFNSHFQFAATDEERESDLQGMINNPSVSAIVSARGGYGTVRIIDNIDFSPLIKNPKWIIGYSDITVLHAHLHALGLQSIHATMPVNFGIDASATESLRKILFGEKTNYSIPVSAYNRQGKAEGILVGGNLSVLYGLIGSKSDIDTKDKILFIEDLNEYLYHIDRMLIALKRAGKLSRLAALLVGGFTGLKDNETPFGKCYEEIILDAVKEYTYPVCFNFPAGHIDNNMALVLGKECEIVVKEDDALFSWK
jgi:muramoyltetrapeptide carboxypeptidase